MPHLEAEEPVAGLDERGFQKLDVVEHEEEEPEEDDDREATEEDVQAWQEKSAIVLTLPKFNADLDRRLRRDKDVVVIVTGEKGEGKSTVEYHLCVFDPNFTFPRNYIFDAKPSSVSTRFKKNVKFSRFGMDEAVQSLYKMDYFSNDQNKLIKLLTRARKYNQMLVLCIPDITEVRTSVRKAHVNVWIHVVERGRAMVFIRDKMPMVEDPWHFKHAERLWKKKLETVRASQMDTEAVVSFLRAHPCYAGEFEFPDMPKDAKKAYLQCVQEYDVQEEGEEMGGSLEAAQSKRQRIALTLLVRWAVEVVGLKAIEVAEKIGYAAPSITQMLKEAGYSRVKEKADKAEANLQNLPPLELEESA